MTELKDILNKHPVVIITNQFDPYCLQTKQFFDSSALNNSKIKFVFVDVEPKGEVIEKQSISLSHSDSLPHIYFNKNYFGGFSEIQELHKKQLIKFKLMDVGAVAMPNFTTLDKILQENPHLICFLNNYSPYSFTIKDVLNEYELESSLIQFIYVDKHADAENLEEAIKYRAEVNDLPVLFLNGKPFCDFKDVENWHKEYTLEKKLADGGLFNGPDVATLDELKNNHSLLVIHDDVSPYSLNVVDAIENLTVTHAVKLFNVSKETSGDGVVKAARLNTKTRQFPYIYLAGKYCKTEDFLKWQKEGDLVNKLKAAGAMR